MKAPSWSLWLLATILALVTGVFQRMTGPTHPVRAAAVLDGNEIRCRLPRSHAGEGDAVISVPAPGAIAGTWQYRRFPSHDGWSEQPLVREGGNLIARLPHQPPAGKVQYHIILTGSSGTSVALMPEPVVLRFRGSVPAPVLILHIVTIFAGMLLGTRAALEALLPRPRIRGLVLHTVIWLVVGGLILGPAVQKYAFGTYWSGWPLGHDLTDNKLAAVVLLWLIAWWRTYRRPPARAWVLAAALLTVVVWLIPHSVLGSEIDYTRTAPASAPAPN